MTAASIVVMVLLNVHQCSMGKAAVDGIDYKTHMIENDDGSHVDHYWFDNRSTDPANIVVS